jgi:DNA-directed RNA polymerase specialized sigma24 family protein
VWDVNAADRATRPDAVLVRAVAGGEGDALAVLYAGHAPWLVVRLTRRCNDADLVDEAVQDTFVAVWRSAGRWDGRGEVAAWIWGIGIRRLIDQLRSRPQRGSAAVGREAGAGRRRMRVHESERTVRSPVRRGVRPAPPCRPRRPTSHTHGQ